MKLERTVALDHTLKLTPEELAYWDVMFDITQAMHDMRKDAGLSLRGLARQLHTSHPTVRIWGTPGYDGYTVKTLIKYAQACGYKVNITFEKEAE